MNEAGQKPEGKSKPTSELDVIGERERIIPVLWKFLTLNPKDPLDEKVALAGLEGLISDFWKTSPREFCDNFLAGTRKRKIENRRLRGKDIGAQSSNLKVIATIILGPNAFRGSTNTSIKSSLIIGSDAFRGLNITPFPVLKSDEEPRLIRGDTYLTFIDNSLIIGAHALTDVKGGIIQNSIIAGPSCLKDANVKIFNSLILNEDGETFIVNETRGHPERYQTVPD